MSRLTIQQQRGLRIYTKRSAPLMPGEVLVRMLGLVILCVFIALGLAQCGVLA